MPISAQNGSGNASNGKRFTSRRAVLASTAAGMVVAAGSATALGGLNATPANAATGVTDWLDITDYGADPTGKDNSSAAIQEAIGLAQPGGVVYMPTGTFLLTGPIVLQKSVTLIGDHGATASGDDAADDFGTVLVVGSGFAMPAAYATYATCAILCLDQSPGTTSAAPTLGIRLRDFWIDGSGGPASLSVDGITCSGPVNAWQAERVGVYKASGSGFNFVQTGDGFPDGQHMYSCVAQDCAQYGFAGQITDATLIECHAQGCGYSGIYMTGGNNRFVGCRSDLNGQHGWYLDHSGAGDGFSDGTILDGCGTQLNNWNGVYVTNSNGEWHDPVLITGCSIGEDGQNGTWDDGIKTPVGGGGYAGIHVEGLNHVHISNTLVAVGKKNVSAGSPQYGIQTASVTVDGVVSVPDSITVTGGRIEAAGTDANLINEKAEPANFQISPETVGAIGYQAPDTDTYFRQGSATLAAGTSGLVTNPWVSSTTLIFLSRLQIGGTAGTLSVSPTTGGFTINSSSKSDSSTVAWMLTTA
jgi:hypothetical protein